MAKIGTATKQGARDQKMREGRLPIAGELLAGVWLLVAAFLFSYSVTLAGAAGFWNILVCGAVITVVAAVRLVAPRAAGWLGLVNVVAGFWLIVSPFALGYPPEGHRDAAKTNALVVGVLVAIFAVTAVTVAARRKAAARRGE
ncbi:SPW repeat domain-containing protein [Amycolatopsis tolypomycina]|uniref:SPW repeat domain-containing protein n=1 Tax=Amycolatopsis tolypomycina TaxID=208445 RepID=UPI0033AD8825